jgi:acetylornithine deacetylase/succinyl-diaminopimelate desuccinylase-like protein
MDIETLRSSFDAEHERFMREFEELLRYDSISAEPDYAESCKACAQWVEAHLDGMGFSTRMLDTPGKPVVYAERKGKAGKPTVLYYAHYDVQPVDPLDLWDSPPFEPTWRNGRCYARGAEDNKGQFFYVLKAIETLIKHDALDVGLKILIEGEEEYGSEGITAKLPEWKDFLSADILLVTDTNTVTGGFPTIVMGLRGIAHLTVTLTGPSHDLHSGIHGGKALNPAAQMVRLINSLHDDDGRVLVEGFYDDVIMPSELEKEMAHRFTFDEPAYRAVTGASPTGGERGYSVVERIGFRPTLEVNGIHSGYGGAGMKTIIPGTAQAKLSMRMVPGQDPEKTLKQVVEHLRKHAHPDLVVDIPEYAIGGPALKLEADSELAQKAAVVLQQVTEMEPVYLWEGASIPILTLLAEVSGSEPLLSGFGCDEGNAHAPNESFSLEQFRTGFLYIGNLLTSFGS